MILNDKEYQCDFCKGVFNFVKNKSWNEELARKEYERNFPGMDWNTREIVCDDCWNIVRPDRN